MTSSVRYIVIHFADSCLCLAAREAPRGLGDGTSFSHNESRRTEEYIMIDETLKDVSMTYDTAWIGS
jgi:hypothetical protein